MPGTAVRTALPQVASDRRGQRYAFNRRLGMRSLSGVYRGWPAYFTPMVFLRRRSATVRLVAGRSAVVPEVIVDGRLPSLGEAPAGAEDSTAAEGVQRLPPGVAVARQVACQLWRRPVERGC